MNFFIYEAILFITLLAVLAYREYYRWRLFSADIKNVAETNKELAARIEKLIKKYKS